MRSLIIVVSVGLWSVAAAVAGPPAITDLKVVLDGDTYVASARLIGGLTPDRIEEIEAGLETTIAYRLRIYRERSGLPNPTIVKRRVECTVRHDALTRQYTLTRRIDGDLQETQVTPDAGVMREFMTVLDRLPVAAVEDLEPGHHYYLKARSDLGLMWRFYLIPWRHRTNWSEVSIEVREVSGDVATP